MNAGHAFGMIGYPPRTAFRKGFLKRWRCAYFLVGLIAGVAMSIVGAGILYLWHLDSHNEADPVYEVIAVGWEPGTEPLYQAAVKARWVGKSKGYEVTADILMGSSNYTIHVGVLGTAEFKKEAGEKFGVIRWTSDEVTFGSETKVAASVKRSELENHR